MKIKTIRLSYGHAPLRPETCSTSAEWQAALRYRVEQVTDSIEHQPDQLLEQAQVKAMCNAEDWKVTIVPVR